VDPLEILTNKNQLLPFFQPIFSADDHKIIGYEVLGRMEVDQDFQSIGSFFEDESVPEEYRIEIDDYITKKALIQLIDKGNLLIFLNRNPNLLMVRNPAADMLILINTSSSTQ